MERPDVHASDARRAFLMMSTASAMAAGLGAAAWRRALGPMTVVSESPYGAPGAPDLNGVAVPAGFGTRLLATTGSVVAGTEYSWHGTAGRWIVFR